MTIDPAAILALISNQALIIAQLQAENEQLRLLVPSSDLQGTIG